MNTSSIAVGHWETPPHGRVDEKGNPPTILLGGRDIVICVNRLWNYSGFGTLARYTCEYLTDNNIPLCYNYIGAFDHSRGNGAPKFEGVSADSFTDMPGEFPNISIQIAPHARIWGKHPHVLYTTVETTAMNCPEFVDSCNKHDVVWTVSEFCRDQINSMGVRVPIEIIYPVIRPPKDLDKNIPYIHNHVTFLFFSAWQPKKGIDELLRAYLSAFDSKYDVSLIIKTNVPKPKYIENKINRIAMTVGHNSDTIPHIIIDNTQISESSKWRLLNSVDVLVHPARCGGFELTVAEARAVGCMIITTDWLPDVIEPTDMILPIRGLELVSPQQVGSIPIYRGSYWGYYDIDDLVDLMRMAYDKISHGNHVRTPINRFSENIQLLASVGNLDALDRGG